MRIAGGKKGKNNEIFWLFKSEVETNNGNLEMLKGAEGDDGCVLGQSDGLPCYRLASIYIMIPPLGSTNVETLELSAIIEKV